MITKTTVYLLNDKEHDSIEFIMDAIVEYCLHHPEHITFGKQLASQLLHCKDKFTEEYTP